MSADYPHNAPWQDAQEQAYPSIPMYNPAPQPGVVWPPPVANDRTNFGMLVVLFIVVAFFFVPQGIANFAGSHLPLFARIGPLLLFYLFPILTGALGIPAHKQARRWMAINQRRQMAATWGIASGVPLADPQPAPNGAALPSYFTLKLKTNWLSSVALACLAMCVPILIWLDFLISFNLSFGKTLQESLNNVSSGFWVFPLIYFAPIISAIVRASVPQRIEIRPEGIVVRHAGYDWARTSGRQFKQQMMLWNDARLFAIRAGEPGAASVRYELASPTTVITFHRIVRPRWWGLFRPAQPFGEYNAQMNALLALISARTVLPLYDVRQGV